MCQTSLLHILVATVHPSLAYSMLKLYVTHPNHRNENKLHHIYEALCGDDLLAIRRATVCFHFLAQCKMTRDIQTMSYYLLRNAAFSISRAPDGVFE